MHLYMNRRLIITLLLMALLSPVAVAQKAATVKSFTITTDHIGLNDRRKDYNGVPCALLKVFVVDDIDRVEGNVIGDVLKRGNVEKWIYLCNGSRNIRLHLRNHLPVKVMFRDYQINGLESNRVYELFVEISDISAPIHNVIPEQKQTDDNMQTLTANNVAFSKSDVENDIQTFNVNGVTFNMVNVEGGILMMDRNQVTLPSFSIGQTEVTQALWYAVMGPEAESEGALWSRINGLGDNYPVYNVSWNDCQSFITKLNQLTGLQFRMPTETEWEFAARGGMKSMGYFYSGSNLIDDVAWCKGNSNGTSGNVATKKANELGIYDMSGNVWEWCLDCYDYDNTTSQTNPTGAQRVYRGGSWNSKAKDCRVGYRKSLIPAAHSVLIGLRLAL